MPRQHRQRHAQRELADDDGEQQRQQRDVGTPSAGSSTGPPQALDPHANNKPTRTYAVLQANGRRQPGRHVHEAPCAKGPTNQAGHWIMSFGPGATSTILARSITTEITKQTGWWLLRGLGWGEKEPKPLAHIRVLNPCARNLALPAHTW